MKLPVAIKTVNDRTGRQTFYDVTDVRKTHKKYPRLKESGL